MGEPDDGSDVLIECRNVYKSFGEKHILRGVSFKVNFLYDIVKFMSANYVAHIAAWQSWCNKVICPGSQLENKSNIHSP